MKPYRKRHQTPESARHAPYLDIVRDCRACCGGKPPATSYSPTESGEGGKFRIHCPHCRRESRHEDLYDAVRQWNESVGTPGSEDL